jgi:hypothetical protein
MEMLSKPAPYTELLDQVGEKSIELALLLTKMKDRKINRLGIMSVTQVAEEEIPPGIRKFIEYMSRPWGSGVEQFNFNVVGVVEEDDVRRDRCVHTIQRPEDDSKLMTLQFDWQREFKQPLNATRPVLEEAMRIGKRAALSYFEALAEGSQFDEPAIDSAA